ncbi:hypothetical protein JQX30_25890 [Saccharopolyspora erythraea]|nr:RAMP superfamily CRISPR-associated protein [Saccharopolyspora erythraea]QRK88124.1 hypothetical protein JQX30_25890 [Saccharopolyspora erythraea]
MARGQGGGGSHDTIDERDQLPATSMAGVVRATAKKLLGSQNPVIDEVFGSDGNPSPWRWSPVRPDGDWHGAQPAARVRIDQHSRTAQGHMLILADHTGADQGRFSITKFRYVPRERLAVHQAVLKVAAQATCSLGAWRRRGSGWVGIRCAEEINEETVRIFLGLKR